MAVSVSQPEPPVLWSSMALIHPAAPASGQARLQEERSPELEGQGEQKHPRGQSLLTPGTSIGSTAIGSGDSDQDHRGAQALALPLLRCSAGSCFPANGVGGANFHQTQTTGSSQGFSWDHQDQVRIASQARGTFPASPALDPCCSAPRHLPGSQTGMFPSSSLSCVQHPLGLAWLLGPGTFPEPFTDPDKS